ncbi:MAG: uracil-DNA glycosylase [Bordetella sp.]|nr:MAG: uracil-DNA glycosylase [Bordetella sp.]
MNNLKFSYLKKLWLTEIGVKNLLFTRKQKSTKNFSNFELLNKSYIFQKEYISPSLLPQNSLDALENIVKTCTACNLCKNRKNPVFGIGIIKSEWMIIGEAPGEQEDNEGLPFVGRSGQLLNEMLKSIGLSRSQDVFITNIVKCRPPGNRNPTQQEISSCISYLNQQISLINPKKILAIGKIAAQTLLNTNSTVSSLRGKIHKLRISNNNIFVLVTYHPAYLLRNPSEKASAWQDLKMASKLQ